MPSTPVRRHCADLETDHYKRRQISLHKPSGRIFLDWYRLRVPRIRAYIELAEFIVLSGLWIAVLQSRTHFEEITVRLQTAMIGSGTHGHAQVVEIVFMVYGLGCAWSPFVFGGHIGDQSTGALDKFASTLEHGWRVYSANVRSL
jgi:hypothetical protein